MLEFRSNFGLDRIRECFEDGSMKIENIPGYTAHYIACPDTFLLASGRSKAGEPIYVQSLALWDYDRYLFQIPQVEGSSPSPPLSALCSLHLPLLQSVLPLPVSPSTTTCNITNMTEP